MTLSSRHGTRNLSPGGLRPSTLPLGHGGSPQDWLSHVDGKETFLFLSNRTPNSGVKGSGANHYPRATRTSLQPHTYFVILSFPSHVKRAVENDFSSYRTYILNQNVLSTMSSILDYVRKPACFLNTRLTLLSYHLLTALLLTMTPLRLQ